MKFPIRMSILVVMILLIVVYGLNMTLVFPNLDDSDYIAPQADAIQLTTKVYFVYDNALRSENRKIDVVDSHFEQAVIDTIKDGPKNTKYQSMFDFGASVISIETINNTCYINLSSDIINSEMWSSERLDLFLWSIVNSLTEIKRVFDVQFLFDGEYLDNSILGYNLQDPLPRIESLNFIKEKTSADIAVQFIDEINASREDLAYELLTDNSKLVYDFNDFLKYADELSQETSGFTRDLYFTKTYSDKQIIYIKFIKQTSENSYTIHFYKHWTLVKENGEFKIDLLKN